MENLILQEITMEEITMEHLSVCVLRLQCPSYLIYSFEIVHFTSIKYKKNASYGLYYPYKFGHNYTASWGVLS